VTTYRLWHVVAVAAGALLVALLVFAFSAANTVPASHAGRSQQAIAVQDIAPPQCAGMGLTTLITNGNGGAGNDLVLGTAAGETLNGNNGDDCLVGGGGDDFLKAGSGTDVCLGGGGANEKFSQCETTYP
jgi:Ca2+-binding RTX toxin-like protein